MKLVVGLGNPGAKYQLTRHNLGFLAVDQMIEKWGAEGPVKKMNGEVYEIHHSSKMIDLFGSGDFQKILLVKPQTYMNRSGECVAGLVQFYKILIADILMLHDDLDLPFGTVRVKTGGGTGGHNGLKSIDLFLGQENNGYHRIRLGIGTPSLDEFQQAKFQSSKTDGKDPADYVLQRMSDKELDSLTEFMEQAVLATEKVLVGKVSEAMNEFNRKKG